jgi:hypothetical protein
LGLRRDWSCALRFVVWTTVRRLNSLGARVDFAPAVGLDFSRAVFVRVVVVFGRAMRIGMPSADSVSMSSSSGVSM